MSLPPRGLTLRVFAVFCLLTISLIHSGTASHAESKNSTGPLNLMPVAYGASIWEYVLTGILLPSGLQIPADAQNDDTSKPAVLAVATVSYTGMTSISCPAEPVATIGPAVPGLTFSQLSRGSGVTCASNTSGISGFGFNGDLPTNLAASKWYKLSIASDSGTAFTVDALSIVASVSTSTAANRINIQYSIDGGAMASIGEFIPTGSSATAYPIVPSSIVAVGPGHTLNLFFVPYNPSASGTTIRIQNNTSITVTTSPVEYTVTYDGNGNTGGTAPADANNPYNPTEWVSVAGPGDLVKAGYTFGGWNTAANGSGTHYNPGQLFAINANTTLYTQWIVAPCFSSGSLDPTFDTDGKVTTSIASGNDFGQAVAIQADGKIVVAGYASNGTNDDLAVARYNTDGSPDTTFSGDGKVTTPILGFDQAYSVAIQPDGKIVAAGASGSSSNLDFAIVRYNSDGSLDTTFDGDGKVTTPIGSSFDGAYSVAIQPDGKIVAAGYTDNAFDTDFAIARYNSDGSPDTTFDGDGKVVTAFGTSFDGAYAVAIQADGKIVAAGTSMNGAEFDFALVRYNSNGSLDPSFDTDGKVTTSVVTSSDQARSVTIQSDSRIVAAGYSFNGTNTDFAVVRYNSNGSLDTSFSGDGKVTTDVLGFDDFALSIAVQPDGKILTAGYSDNGSDQDFSALRYNANGSLDASFDADGKVTTQVGISHDQANAVAIQPDGRIVAAGYSLTGSNADFAVVRYGGNCPPLPPDLSITNVTHNEGNSGTTTFSFTVSLTAPAPPGGVTFDIATADNTATTADNDYVARSLSLQTINAGGTSYTFDVLVNGDTTPEANERFSVNVTNVTGASVADGLGRGTIQNDDVAVLNTLSYNGNGNTGGTAPVDANNPYNPTEWVSVAGPGDLVKAGYTFGGWNTAANGTGTHYNPAQLFAITADTTLYAEWVIAPCFNSATGSLDPSFDGDGKVTTITRGGSGIVNVSSMAIQPDGKIVAAGSSPNGSNRDFSFVRYNPDGLLDTSFGIDGIVMHQVQIFAEDVGLSVAIQPDGKIVAVGWTDDGTGSLIGLMRLNTDGSLDTSFGAGGIAATDLPGSGEMARSVAIQPDGKIVVAGQSGNGPNTDFAVLRYRADGLLDTSFGTGGTVITDVLGADDVAQSVVIQPDGKIVVVGQSWNVSNTDFAVVRYNSDGSLDTSFDTDGKVVTDVQNNNPDLASSGALQPDGRIVVAGSSLQGLFQFALLRYNTDGSLDTSFDTDGKVVTSVHGEYDFAYSVVVQADGKIVAAGRSLNGPNYDFGLARYNTDGSLDTSFDGDGKVTTGVLNSDDEAYAVAIQRNGRIVAAGQSFRENNFDFALVRYGSSNCDTSPPDTTITANPPDPSANANASFSFTGTDEPGGSGVTAFECSIDGGAFAACTSPQSYHGLSEGPHTFNVRAIDGAGNADATPASYTWVIDTTPPDTTITVSPPDPSGTSSASFSFASNEAGAVFACSLDGAAFAACTSPQIYSGLSDGPHTFQVRAVDAAGNVDPTPASHPWVIDTMPPDTTITGNPTNPTNSTSASFTFTSNETSVTFECSLDGAAFAACTSPKSYTGLALGSHTFQVRAKDSVGNTDPTPASYTWVINSPPTISAAGGVTRVQAAGPSISQIATVGDPDQAPNTLAVTVNGGPSATVNGVTVNSITIAPSGAVSASVSAACGATNASFTLRVTDSGGLFAQATLAVTVINETVPPVINPIANVIATLPLNSPATSMAVSFPLPTATDNCGAVVVTTNPVSGSVFNIGNTTVNVTATDANGNVSTATFTVSVQYPFSGFTGRVYNPPATNYATAGNTLPMSFSLGGNKGLNIFAAGSPSSQQVSCATGTPVGAATPAIGNLMYFGQYSYYWTTDPAWGGTCRRFSMTLNDGSTRTLNFWFYNTPGVPPVFIKPGRTRLDLMMPVD
ncbi:MAG: PxKF domain-containing protein [Acidobacteria bacterium]|nr:PxKF domain-containing protein [Acidobacteriota bacterium]